jgi:hypothetical protein
MSSCCCVMAEPTHQMNEGGYIPGTGLRSSSVFLLFTSECRQELKKCQFPGHLRSVPISKIAFQQPRRQWLAVAINLPSPWRMRAGLGHYDGVSVSLGRRHCAHSKGRDFLAWSGDAYPVRPFAATQRQCPRAARAGAIHSSARTTGHLGPPAPTGLRRHDHPGSPQAQIDSATSCTRRCAPRLAGIRPWGHRRPVQPSAESAPARASSPPSVSLPFYRFGGQPTAHGFFMAKTYRHRSGALPSDVIGM